MTRLRHMKRLPVSTAILPVFLVVHACSSIAPSTLPDSNAPLLSGTSWTATVIGNDFTAGRRPTIQFREDGKAAGSTGCTVFFASAQIAGSTLQIRNLELEPAAERPGTCDSLHLAQQTRFLRALESTRLARKQSGQILLLDARQNLLALLERRAGPRASNDPLNGMELVAVTPALGQYFGADAGVLVTRVSADNPFELREGDVILSVNGRQPANGPHALRILRSYPPGTTLDLRVRRQRESLNLRVTLSE